MLTESNYFVGTVAAVFFQNPSNFYKVLLIKVAETNLDFREKEIVATGTFGDIKEEESYRFFGELIEHPRYGLQFQVLTYQQEQPTSANGLIAYFSGEKFPGIGKKTAQAIVESLGEQAIERMLADPSLLEQIPSLNAKKRQLLLENVRLNHGMDQVIVGLTRYGFGSQLAFAVYQAYKNEALDIIQENPYQLVEDIEGIGFKKADAIAEQLGIEATSAKRLRAAIIHQVFQQSLQTGNTFVAAQELLENTLQILETARPVEIQPESLAQVIIELVEEGKIQQDEINIYENSLYFAEWGIANSLERLLQRKAEIHYPEKTVTQKLRQIEKRSQITYGKSQEAAILAAIRSPFFVLTGGPGTGKTTVINGIVQLFAELNDIELDASKYTQEMFPILLAAPTGRAAKRMNDTTGLPSGTIHRLLGLTGREKTSAVVAKELEGGLLIVDELSMVDTWLANTLLKAIPTNMQVIFVGDKDQLPSVGPGQVLHDLLQIEEIPKCELTEIYRQGDDSSIIPLAHQIKQGQLPTDFLENQPDRSFFACDAYQIEHLIAQVVKKAKAKGFTPQDIQVLAPMYRGAAGIDALNKMMQEIFNPNDGSRKEVKFNEVVYRIGDKVLQLVNVPEDNVFNGDMGQIVGITLAKDSADKVDELVIQFDAVEVTYKRNEWNKITLAYCCSIHKSQGSEFKMVILPMVHQYQRMLQRNLLYTAVTRSKELLILMGEERAYQVCVTQESAIRQTTLKERIANSGSLSITLRNKINHYEDQQESNVFETESRLSQPKKVQPLKEAVKEVAKATPQKPIISEELKTQVMKETILTPHLVTSGQIDPMIGMQGITPEQFLL
ncbi:MAG: ATP-dependent RecD-like DNA helicase [Enterococcus sp.]